LGAGDYERNPQPERPIEKVKPERVRAGDPREKTVETREKPEVIPVI
jgi:hypothetical protein